MGPVSVARLGRFLAENPDTVDMSALLEVPGMSEERVRVLAQHAHLERPRTGLLSPSLWDFLSSPGVQTFLTVLARSDLFLWFGDHGTASRRVTTAGGGPLGRFTDLLELVEQQASRTSSVADGATASEAVRWLARRQTLDGVLANLVPVTGDVLLDGAYVPAVAEALTGAQVSVDVLMFLGTSAAGSPQEPGPAVLVDALVAAAARGVAVRVVLDQDDGGEPYRSAFINRALVARLQAGGVPVRLDDPLTLLHSKVVVVDDRTTVIGSHNWTANSLSTSHETSVLLRSPDVALRARARFEALWTTLPDLPRVP
jgi:phosphatidylserine/phosphatidylglycerophosphate/cardiolipin synthase-like enzyme